MGKMFRTRHRLIKHQHIAMTLPEVALLAITVALALAVVTGIHGYLVKKAKEKSMAALLEKLTRSTLIYHAEYGVYIPSTTLTADPVVKTYLKQPECASSFDNVSEFLLDRSTFTCKDAWGTPIRYIPVNISVPSLAQRVKMAGDIPLFESAGPDRSFGDDSLGQQSDNLRSDGP